MFQSSKAVTLGSEDYTTLELRALALQLSECQEIVDLGPQTTTGRLAKVEVQTQGKTERRKIR